MVKIKKRWDRQRKKSPESTSPSNIFKVHRVPVKKRKPKHPGYTVIQCSLYGFFENNDRVKQG